MLARLTFLPGDIPSLPTLPSSPMKVYLLGVMVELLGVFPIICVKTAFCAVFE